MLLEVILLMCQLECGITAPCVPWTLSIQVAAHVPKTHGVGGGLECAYSISSVHPFRQPDP